MKKFISPSICCCDLSCLEESVHELERLHVEYIHVDIMDGEFVNNYCLGTEFIPLLHRRRDRACGKYQSYSKGSGCNS